MKFICSALCAVSQTQMTDFPTLSYTSTSKIRNPFIYLKPEKGTTFGHIILIKAIIGRPPPAPWAQEQKVGARGHRALLEHSLVIHGQETILSTCDSLKHKVGKKAASY